MKRLITLSLVLMMVLGSVLLTACTSKGDEFVVGLDDAFPPMGYRDEKNEIVGFDVDLAKEVAKRMGVEIKFQPIVWDSKDTELDTGNIDCIWNGFTINGREDDYTWTKPYMKNKQIIIVLADSSYQTLADLAGKTLSLQSGSSAETALNDNETFKSSLGNTVFFEDNMKALMDLEIKQSDAVLMDETVAAYNIKESGGESKYRILGESLAEEEFGVGFKKGNTELKDKVQKALDDMAADGKLAEIAAKWLLSDAIIVG